MSNSVVKVTELSTTIDEDLVLLVGEDGTVTPSKDVVKAYLNSKPEGSNLQVIQVNKSNEDSIEVDIKNMLYLPDIENESDANEDLAFNEIAYNLQNVKLDHDYTSQSPPFEEVDELARTLSILDGNAELLEVPTTSGITRKKSASHSDNGLIKTKPTTPKSEKTKPKTEHKELKKAEVDSSEPKTEKNKALLVPKLDKSPKIEKKPEKKKEKKPTKNVLDEFPLFSTPDIIKRVGGKEVDVSENKPAKIEVRSKSTTESPSPTKKENRLSLDGKQTPKSEKQKSASTTPKSTKEPPTLKKDQLSSLSFDKAQMEFADLMTSDTKMECSDSDANAAVDSTLDLDPALLDNINNDLISEDILYQVAQSLASSTELQQVLDKTLGEENLNLSDAMATSMEDVLPEQPSDATPTQGTKIVRADGRVVTIPPIERPATRSRNKKKEEPSIFKFNRKPLDDEHVSGNELDSSGEEEEESEDDPNKLWCICNQPHNNRFMICCDTCEEWYHGKCVNVTKAMGQQMESEGKEWICLFCKDPQLKRPQSAAKRIRKASRNSRHSSDSNGSAVARETKVATVPCVVCQKPSRNNSIFCSETCILAHAQGVERVLVFDRNTGNMLTGNKAPSATNLEQWLREHPGYEVVRSAGKIVTAKTQATPGRIKLLNSAHREKDKATPRLLKPITKHEPPKTLLSPKNIPAAKVVKKSPIIQSKDKPVNKESKLVAKDKTPTSSKVEAMVINKEKIKLPRSRSLETPQKNKHENIRENVQKTIFEQLTNRLKLSDDIKLTEQELKDISSEIESQLYKCFGDTGQKYRTKYRSLIFNIKDVKNQTLWRRICEKSINPYQLVRLSPDDLASQELALWREREAKHQLDMIKKSELELLNCNRQYVLKTHKGEQILEENRPTDHIDSTEVITSLTDCAEKTERKSDEKKHHKHRDKERKSRKRSRSKEKTSKHSDKKRSRSRERDKHKRSHKSSRHKKDSSSSHRTSFTEQLDKKSKEILEQLVENKIVPSTEDRLWKDEEVSAAPSVESDSDHEPSSTVTIPTPPRQTDADEGVNAASITTNNENEMEEEPEPVQKQPEEIWRGVINMIDVAQISITAHEVSGDCNGLSSELPAHLDIVGRISPETVWDYIGKMKCSNSKIISVVRLNAINAEEKMPYLALYSYLSSRNRLGVVKSTNKAVKDFYILPLAAQKPIPQALLPLSGPGFEETRPALLLGIIVRDKRKRPYMDISLPVNPKKSKVEINSTTRSYTPPPVKAGKLALPLPPALPDQNGDEPYSPEDSDPDNSANSTIETSTDDLTNILDVKSKKFQLDTIPGLDSTPLPSNTLEIQRQMEKLNKEIEMQKSEINSISQNIATASTEIGSTALANIALPSNLQQILDSIKTIGSTPNSEVDKKQELQENAELTIPLILPTAFPRAGTSSASDTIPLNLPNKKKLSAEVDKSGVLSSLSEEDLIRKAEEMLKDTKKDTTSFSKSKTLFNNQPPIPGLDDP